MDISDKVVIITGASAGIGQMTARRFAVAGAKVVLVARSTDKLTRLAEELSRQGHDALPISADMRNQGVVTQMIEQTFQHYGRIDNLGSDTNSRVKLGGFIRREDAAKYLGISMRTLTNWQQRRVIPVARIGHRIRLFRIADLDRAMRRFTLKAAGDEA